MGKNGLPVSLQNSRNQFTRECRYFATIHNYLDFFTALE